MPLTAAAVVLGLGVATAAACHNKPEAVPAYGVPAVEVPAPPEAEGGAAPTRDAGVPDGELEELPNGPEGPEAVPMYGVEPLEE